MFACLFNLDSTKSPIVPIMDTIAAMINQLVKEKFIEFKLLLLMIYAVISAQIKPPIKPSIVFLGETETNNFLFPKFFPTIKAKLSFTQIRTNTEIIK